jgi:hypothetical protein
MPVGCDDVRISRFEQQPAEIGDGTTVSAEEAGRR